MSNNRILKKLLMLALFVFPLTMFAQSSGSLQRVTLTSITLLMDSARTPADYELIRQEITKHPEVKDFDIKAKDCNFTIDNSNNTLDVIFSDLAQRGQPARIYMIEANQTFTRVPEESCLKSNVPEVKEKDVKKPGVDPQGDR
jgi:hypothetical protein